MIKMSTTTTMIATTATSKIPMINNKDKQGSKTRIKNKDQHGSTTRINNNDQQQ